MHSTIWQSIASTYWLAYVFVGFFINLSYIASKPQKLPVRNFFIIPPIFIILTIISMIYFLPVTPDNLAAWVNMLVLGSGLGWLHFRALNIKINRTEKKLMMPGSLVIFFILIGIAAAKYFYGSGFSLSTHALKSPHTILMVMSSYGLLSGIFIGRAAYTWRALKHGPYTTESLPAH